MNIEAEGFLSRDIGQLIERHRKDYSKVFTLCEQLNEFAQKMMLSLEPHNRCLVEMLGASFLSRGMSSFQGMILLGERGMINEARYLLRCLLEVTFAISAIAKDPGFADTLCKNDLYEQKRCFNAVLGGSHLSDEDMRVAREELEKVRRQIKLTNLKELSIRDIATAGGLIGMYDSAYKMLSSIVHVSVRSLGETIEVGEDGDAKEMLWGPDVRDLELVLLTGLDMMMIMLKALRQIFSLGPSADLELLQNGLQEGWKTFVTKEPPASSRD